MMRGTWIGLLYSGAKEVFYSTEDQGSVVNSIDVGPKE